VDGYVPARDKPTLEVGTMVHRGLESFWKGESYAEAVGAMDALRDRKPLFWETEEGVLALAKSKLYLWGYYYRWMSSMDDFVEHKTTVEDEFRLKIDKLSFAGKFDVVTKDANTGRWVIIEHKTAGSHASNITSPYWEKLPMDVQLTLYREAVRRRQSLDYVPDVIYDVLITTSSEPSQRKPYVRKRKNESVDSYNARKAGNKENLEEYFERVTPDYYDPPHVAGSAKYIRRRITVTKQEHQERLAEIISMARLLEPVPLGDYGDGEATSPWTHIRNTSSCKDFGGCEFLNVCLSREGLESASYMKREIHPELTILNQEEK
jgi:hypothetical protein